MESIFYKQTMMGDVIALQMIKEIFTGDDIRKPPPTVKETLRQGQ